MSSAISTGSVLARTLSRKPASISITAGEQAQMRGSSLAGRHVQRERNIDGHPIEARPFNGLGQFKHGNARRVDRVAFGMRNGKTGDKAGLGLVLASNEGGLYGRCVIGKAELDGLLGQIM